MNSHINLKFLDELDDGQIEQINQITNQIINDLRPFKVQIKDSLVFPNPERPRVLSLKVIVMSLRVLAIK